jgi:hypothetical protein
VPKPESFLPPITFKQARWFTPGRPGRKIDLLVVHSMEAPEHPRTAENCASYFATCKVKASAHYNLDCDSIVRSVKDKDIAYGAPYVNARALHFELAGYASQSAAAWDDKFSRAMLKIAARLIAVKCFYNHIPPVWLTPAQIKAGSRGIASHANITIAYKRKGGHTDPGAGFPVAAFMKQVQQVYAEFADPTT